ncbi:tRNA(Met) cytidine acetyltransferase TmcA [Sansalvadorimonas verongulae]|uniref:tRNA(Met) cytidine acetyltransferase TmcA n=1 Tax=Sansalvadorimonas verongulae TaxID=2172824 RepID=UPI0012BB913B|nr:GNAT family N-acetyltransferase [Sansalvadorimonas verongulae]MTI13908.1 tRNA(Met) cytidine acetyltransferase [Sansalvadorimonas verongulae]
MDTYQTPSGSTSNTLQYLAQALPVAARNNHRLPLLLSGSQPWLSGVLEDITTFTQQPYWFFSDRSEWGLTNVQPWKQAKKLLGQSIALLILDLTEVIPADALGIVSGALQGGGLLVLLLPPKCQWPQASPFHLRASQLLERCNLPHLTEAGLQPLTPQKLEQDNNLPQPPCATQDQERAVTAIKRVLTGHRRRPLVITADRGRGKSSALGIAAAQLLTAAEQEQQRSLSILITAPSRKAADTVFHHGEVLLPQSHKQKNVISLGKSQIRFIAPDELASQEHKASLVLVDEAAALPAPLLEKLLRKYSRIVFASTIHGYEGTGRGFAIRFKKTLNAITPKWQQCELKEPIRWNSGDPAEQLMENLLLLNADAASDEVAAKATLESTSFHLIQGAELRENEIRLREVFGLLVNAHYQTRPDDLVHMLDREDLDTAVLTHKTGNDESVIAAALVSHEGEFNEELSQQIWAGKRRPKGHLLPQTLAAQGGFREAPQLKMARVMRIAVHSAVQGTGFGQHLMQRVADVMAEKGFDLIGTSFGATSELLSFWGKCTMQPLHIGSTRNSASGCHSVIVGQGLSTTGQCCVEQWSLRYFQSLPFLAHTVLGSLEHGVLLHLMQRKTSQLLKFCPRLEEDELELLHEFCNGYRNLDACLPELHKLSCTILPEHRTVLTDEEQAILTCKILQNQSWADTVRHTGLTGKKEAEHTMLRSVQKLLKQVAIESTH